MSPRCFRLLPYRGKISSAVLSEAARNSQSAAMNHEKKAVATVAPSGAAHAAPVRKKSLEVRITAPPDEPRRHSFSRPLTPELRAGLAVAAVSLTRNERSEHDFDSFMKGMENVETAWVDERVSQHRLVSLLPNISVRFAYVGQVLNSLNLPNYQKTSLLNFKSCNDNFYLLCSTFRFQS